jgi:hypothetical protein
MNKVQRKEWVNILLELLDELESIAQAGASKAGTLVANQISGIASEKEKIPRSGKARGQALAKTARG